MEMSVKPQDVNWETLGSGYINTGKRFRAYDKDGKGREGQVVEADPLTISGASPAVHLGRQCFEGLKAYRTKDGSVNLFRVDENAKRLARSADQVMLPPYPEE